MTIHFASSVASNDRSSTGLTLNFGPLLMAALSMMLFLQDCAVAQTPPQPPARNADHRPEEATRAILSLFDTYQVVGMTAAHRMKDLDDFILLLLSEPRPAHVFVDNEYMAELHRRAGFRPGPINDQIEPEKIREQDANTFLNCRG